MLTTVTEAVALRHCSQLALIDKGEKDALLSQ